MLSPVRQYQFYGQNLESCCDLTPAINVGKEEGVDSRTAECLYKHSARISPFPSIVACRAHSGISHHAQDVESFWLLQITF